MSITSLVLATALAATGPTDEKVDPRAAVDATVPSSFDGTLIRYHAEGSGSPALVLIPCWMGDSTFWREQVPVFAKGHRVVTLDLPGHGRSGKDRKTWTMAAFGRDVRTVVEKLGLEKVVLVGNSMGGYVMLEAEHVMPERVVGLVAVDALHDADAREDPKEQADWHAALQKDFAKSTVAMVRQVSGKKTPGAVVDRIAATMSGGDPAIGLALSDDMDRYDLAASFRATRAPLVAINARLLPTNVTANRKYLKKYDVILLPEGVGHFPQLEAPSTFDELLSRALAILPSR